jgi:hypothetical protein
MTKYCRRPCKSAVVKAFECTKNVEIRSRALPNTCSVGCAPPASTDWQQVRILDTRA